MELESLIFKVENANAGFISLSTSFNTLMGASTPASSMIGVGNSGFGTNALALTTSSNNNTAVGANAQRSSTAASNKIGRAHV